jgi:hypothetical protein
MDFLCRESMDSINYSGLCRDSVGFGSVAKLTVNSAKRPFIKSDVLR